MAVPPKWRDKIASALRPIRGSTDLTALSAADVEAAILALSKLPPCDLQQARFVIEDALDQRTRNLNWQQNAQQQLKANPRLAALLMFHYSGYARQAALDVMDWPLDGGIFVTALVARLNDWVPEVRVAALRCAERVLPQTGPEPLADALLEIADRLKTFGRWSEPPAVLDQSFQRTDVGEALARRLVAAGDWRVRSFQTLLRYGSLDQHLPELAARAVKPAIRAIATQTLILGEARWIDGYEWQWTDKSLGKRRRVNLFSARPVARPATPEELIQQAAKDRSTAVRRVAVAALYVRELQISNATEIAELLSGDKNAAIRKRADFFLGMAAKPQT